MSWSKIRKNLNKGLGNHPKPTYYPKIQGSKATSHKSARINQIPQKNPLTHGPKNPARFTNTTRTRTPPPLISINFPSPTITSRSIQTSTSPHKKLLTKPNASCAHLRPRERFLTAMWGTSTGSYLFQKWVSLMCWSSIRLGGLRVPSRMTHSLCSPTVSSLCNTILWETRRSLEFPCT